MENKMQGKMQKKKAVFDTSGKGTFDAMGNSPQDADPTVTAPMGGRNMASLRPGGGIGDGSADAMRAAMMKMGLMPKNEEEDMEEEEGDEEEMKEGFDLDVSDFAEALFEGEELSESFKTKCIAIFEAAVNEKVAQMEQAMIKASAKLVQEQVTTSVETITEGVDKYLTYVCEEWMKENELAVEQGMKTEIVENFIHGLKDLFENSFVDVPDEKYNVVDELFEANSELESKLNEQINENINLRNTLIAHQCAEVFSEASQGLADTEIEKFASLAEGLEFDSVDQYREKIAVLRESYFGGEQESQSTLLGENYAQEPLNQVVSNDPFMDGYIQTISKHLKLTNNKVTQK